MKKTLISLSLLFFFVLIFPNIIFATIGVGVGTGKIRVEDQLKPGMVYHLPKLSVINTGDEEAQYAVTVTYHQDQEQLEPSVEWFDFSPDNFKLKPGEAKVVEIKLSLPVKTEPGDYFAYLEAYPDIKAESGNTSIGVAAASKLYFTVVPGNIFQGFYYKMLYFWKTYHIFIKVIVIGVIVVYGIKFAKKFLNIDISVKKKDQKSIKKKEKKDE